MTVSSTQRDVVYVGHIVSMTRRGDEYFVQFDPEWDLVGVTGSVAQAQDEHVACVPRRCPGVPNDVYRVDETHRTYTFVLPAGATGTVLTRSTVPGASRVGSTRITAAHLAALVGGKGTSDLFEPLLSGVQITVRVDTIVSFAQLYQP